MKISRRNFGLSALVGALATGLPAAFLLDPRRALADGTCTNKAKAQFFILSTSGGGDPINANMPGTYDDANIIHPVAFAKGMPIKMGTTSSTAALPWTQLSQKVLDRTMFFHLMTNTPVHPKEPDVLSLMGATSSNEMFPSILARQMAPCLSTIQTQPISVGAAGPGEALRFGGAPQPIIKPRALAATLLGTGSPLAAANIQSIRDKALNQIYDVYKNDANEAQKAYIDSMILSQSQLRSIDQNVLQRLSVLTDDGPDMQVNAAIILFLMKITPVVSIHIPFGGDNHFDTGLPKETAETISGVQTISNMMSALKAASLDDMVTFFSLNVFGRTLGKNNPINANGRNHSPIIQSSIVIGKPFKGGIVGGLTPIGNDFGCGAIDSATGKMAANGDVPADETLGAFAKTLLVAVGGDHSTVLAGKPITGALA